MTSVDENVFFREATLRLCSSLDIETALKRCYEYVRLFIPVRLMALDVLDLREHTLRVTALVGADAPENYEHVVHLPEKSRSAFRDRAAFWKTDEVVRIVNLPDPSKVPPLLLERLAPSPSRTCAWSWNSKETESALSD